MNKIVNKIMIIVALVFLLFSCENKEPEVFSEPSSVRMKNVIDDYNSTLQGAEKGWLFEYFPHEDLIYGGYNFYITFSEDKATVMNEFSGKTKSSDYVVKSSGGPVLSFNTYNPIMHYYATPWGSEEGYQGRKGDFEFVLMGKEGNQINLEGVRTRNKMRLIKLSVSKEEYNQKVREYSKLFNKSNTVRLTVNGEAIKVVRNTNRNLSVTYENEKKEIVNTSFPYLITNEGIKFYEPYKIKGTEFYKMIFDKANNKFISEDKKTEILIIKPPYKYRNGWLSEKDKERSASFEALWTQLVTNYDSSKPKAWGYTLNTSKFYLGRHPINNIETAVTFIISKDGKDAYGICGMTFSLVPGHEDQIAIKKGQGIKNWQFFDALTKDFVDALQSKSPYTVVLDDKDNPTKVKLTSVADSNYWFTLYSK